MSHSSLTHVATFVAGDPFCLTTEFAHAVQEKTGAARTEWLATCEAFDLYFENLSPEQERTLRADFSGCSLPPFDLIIQPVANRKKKLLGIDMEMTAIGQELLDEMAEIHGCGAEVKKITNEAMHNRIDFRESVCRRVALFKGCPIDLLWDVAKRITFTPDVETLVGTVKANQGRTCLITGGFSFFTDIVASILGIDVAYANRLEIRDDVLTGRVLEPIYDGEAKLDLLCREQRRMGVSLSNTIMLGDGGNDLPALNGVNAAGGLGIGFGAKSVLKDVPHRLRESSSLAGALYAQGYKKSQFVKSASLP